MIRISYALLFFLCFIIQGCASFGKGVAEAFLEKQESEDTRLCQVWGESFDGLSPNLNNKKGRAKVLMVHGVGDHIPGYSTQFFEKLATALKLTVKAKKFKDIALTSPLDPSKKLGNLRINRLLSKNRKRELLFYELTWSQITASEKALLAYDNSGEYSFRRAEVNDLLKKFSNDTGPDPIIYLGESREDILTAFAQSFCWMISNDWEDLPQESNESCLFNNPAIKGHLQNDHYALISHSLGSRITIDGLQRIASLLSEKNSEFKAISENEDQLINALKRKEITSYMLSNQLPMLQLGRKLPDVTGKKDSYCRTDGENYDERILSKTSIIAFSDPNDLLSYAIPHGFAEKYLDSRLCVDITNININVATIFDAFGLGKMANPLDAHIGYDTDDRVVALIANGIGNHHTADIVEKRCQWIETID
ncbi:MAG: hypothetical protein ACU833_02910 [Gammaproteobacteria bacterium]